MNDWERAICARVKTVRESIRWSQPAFAEQLGITVDQLASIEYGRTPLRYDVAWRLRQAFGISLRWLEEGFWAADRPEHDNLPLPNATGLSARALLSTVAQSFDEGGDERLVSIGPEPNEPVEPDQPPSKGELETILTTGKLPDAMLRILEGQESATGATDVRHREILEQFLKMRVEEWIARVPLGRAEEFSDKICSAALEILKSFPQPTPGEIDQRAEEIMWERIRTANAKKILVAAETQRKVLPDIDALVKTFAVKALLPNLLDRVRQATSSSGMKSELADYLGVPLVSLSRWLSGKREPGGETTLRLLAWVASVEAQQQKSPGRVRARPEPKTQPKKSLRRENQSQARRKT